jgi:Holliday junction resolvase
VKRAARIDDNHRDVVEALRQLGASVVSLAAGVPDALVGLRGKTYLVEIKDGSKSPSRRRLTPDQVAFVEAWRGSPVVILTSVDDAIDWAAQLVSG